MKNSIKQVINYSSRHFSQTLMAVFVFMIGIIVFYTHVQAALIQTPEVLSVQTEATPTPAPQTTIANPSVEIASSNPSIPSQWETAIFGKNTTTATYPAAGYEGESGLRLQMTQRTNGNATWQFDPVLVTPGQEYTFSDYYQSNVQTALEAEYTMADGTFLYAALGKVAASTTWKKKTVTFTVPANAVKVSVLHLLNKVGYLNTDLYSLQVKDVVAPTVSITSPANNATVSATMQVNVSASDNVAVTGVQLKLDGVNYGTEVTSAPFDFYIDTTALSNTTHTLVAVARDAAGNTKTSSSISVVVANSTPTPTTTPTATPTVTPTATPTTTPTIVPTATPTVTPSPTPTVAPTATPTVTPTTTPTSTPVPTVTPTPIPGAQNIVLNPSFEIAGTGNNPANWVSSSWGTNTATFTYPVSGIDGVKAAKIEVTNYTDGDAKWVFDNVAVVANSDNYVFSDSYKSNATSYVVAQYTLADNSVQYSALGVVPSSDGNWATFSQSFATPVNAVSMTIFHLLQGTGELTVDKYSVTSTETVESDRFSEGIVSLTFDDGLLSHYTNAMPILNSKGMKGTFYAVSQFSLNNSTPNQVPNNSLESDAGNGNPNNWNRGNWGTNSASFTYPAAGVDGPNAVKVSVNGYTDGDAKWYFDDVLIESGTIYTYRDAYNSDTESKLTVRYTMADDSVQYSDLATFGQTSGNWNTAEVTFTTPQNVKSMTMFHLIASNGELSVDNVRLNEVADYVTPAQLVEMQNAGHEIGAHSRTHASLTSISQADAQTEINGSISEILGMGISSVTSFAYPYGNYNATIQNMMQSAGMTSARSVVPGYALKSSDKYGLKGQSLEVNTSIETVKQWIDTAKAGKTWLILIFHPIDNSGSQYSTTPAMLTEIVNYLEAQNMPVKTVREVLPLMN